MSFAFFFPGQGSQSLNMMAGFEGVQIVKDTFNEASEVLGSDLWAMITGSDEALINATVNTQPIMLAAGVAIYRAYLEAGGGIPIALAGHSLGEYTALVATNSLNFTDAIKLVRSRAEFMQEAVPQGKGAMAAILGLEDEEIKAVCMNAGQGEIVEAVNFNAKGQVVIAGETSAVERAIVLAKEAGAKRAMLLPVSVPSHCTLMKGAAKKLQAELENIIINTPEIRVIHNADVKSYTDGAEIKQALVRQLYSPVLWTQTVSSLADEGIALAAECGPGKVLAGLTKRITDKMRCQALTKMDDVVSFINAE